MLRALFPVLLLLVAAHPVSAQQARRDVPHVGAGTRETVTTFTIQSAVPMPDDSIPRVPPGLLEQLAADANLASLEVEGSADRESARVTLQFVFASEAAFQGWYRSPAARELIALLRRLGTIQHFQLGVKRYPLAGMLPPG